MVQGEIVLELTGSVWLSQEKIKRSSSTCLGYRLGWGQSSHEADLRLD